MTVDVSNLFLGVEDQDAARQAFERPAGTRNTELWQTIADAFVTSEQPFQRIDPSRIPADGRAKPYTAGDVANALKRYADTRNLPMSARTYGDGTVLLARVERQGEPVEVSGPGRPKGRRSRAAEAE